MAQGLRVFSVLAEDWNSFSSTHIKQICFPPPGLLRHLNVLAHILPHRHTHIQIIKYK